MKTRNPIQKLGWFAIHAWIVFHFASVVIAPASVPPASSIAQNAWSYCGGYLQLLFLNHGYHFFAPDPGGSTLIAYEATLPDGTLVWGRIPNREIFPRLNYHRHFMLTEHMAVTISQQPELESLLAETYAGEIAHQTGASHLVLYEVFHELSTPEQVRAGRHLDDPVTFQQRVLGEFDYITLPSSIETTNDLVAME